MIGVRNTGVIRICKKNQKTFGAFDEVYPLFPSPHPDPISSPSHVNCEEGLTHRFRTAI